MADKKFYLWQVLFLAMIGLFIWQKWWGSAIALGVLEIIIIYAHFRTKEENQYVLPASVARTMKAAPEQVSHEATILSTALLIIGGIAFAVYYAIYVPADWVVKAFIIFNSLCLALFMLAQLNTAYRQYVSLMETQKLINSMATETIEIMKPTVKSKEDMKGGTRYGKK